MNAHTARSLASWNRFARSASAWHRTSADLKMFDSNESGAAAVEFAFVAAPFFAIVFMTFQVALYHFGVQSLDHSTRLAARLVMTGELPASARGLQTFKNQIICPNLMANLACDKIIVNAYKVSPESDADLDTGIYRFVDDKARTLFPVDMAQGSFCIGGPGDFVLLDVAYKMPSFVGDLLGMDGGKPPMYLMRSTTLIRNEPYSGEASAC